MKTAQEFARIANRCLIPNPPEQPTFDLDKFSKKVNIKEKEEFLRLITLGLNWKEQKEIIESADMEELKVLKEVLADEDDSKSITQYRGKFYTMEKHKGKLVDGPSGLPENSIMVILRDEHGEIHTIYANGKVAWTKEL